VQEIRAALQTNDTETAQRTAHSLKGSAANLGANALATAAGSAEVAIKTQGNVEPALQALETLLSASVAAIRTALPATEAQDAKIAGHGDPAAVLEPLSRLKNLLAADDSEAADFIVEARGTLAAALSGNEIETLTRMVGDFDYEGALSVVAGIADRLSLKLE